MNAHAKPALIALNVALLAMLAVLTVLARTGRAPASIEPSAFAQSTSPSGPGRPRGQYMLLSGRMQSSPGSAVYVVDTINQEVAVLRWDRSVQTLALIGKRNMLDDAKSAGGVR